MALLIILVRLTAIYSFIFNLQKNIELGVALILCYVMLCCLILCAKSDALKKVKSYALLCCVMICYADLFYEQNPMLSMSKIL